MIDINNPRSEFIFKAAAFTDKIKDSCRVYIVQDFENRKETFEKMKLICEDLKVFSVKHFKENSEKIIQLADELISEITTLANINNTTKDGNCNVCDSKLKIVDSRVKEVGMITLCQKCPSKIYDITYDIDSYTGASFI